MAKIVLNDVTNINSLSVINDNFDKLEDALQDKVLYRDNPVGEVNTVEQDIDLNGFRLLNIGAVVPGTESFPAKYLGAFTANPTVGLNGEPLSDGMLYFRTGAPFKALMVWNGAVWAEASPTTLTVTNTIDPSLIASNAETAAGASTVKIVTPSSLFGSISASTVWNAVSNFVTRVYNGFLQGGTGATARTVENKLREIISIKDFGAVGDGVTDDSAAIQAAIDYAAGREILAPAGVYLVGTGLSYSTSGESPGFKMKGVGIGKTFFDTRVANGYLLTLDGTGTPSTYAIGGYLTGVSIITNASAVNSGGILLKGQWLGTITKNKIKGLSGDSIRIVNDDSDADASGFLTISDNWLQGCGGWAINMTDPAVSSNASGHIRITKNYVLGNALGGIRFLGAKTEIVENSIAYNTGAGGLVIAYSASSGAPSLLSVLRNEFDGNTGYHIDVQSCLAAIIGYNKLVYSSNMTGIRVGDGVSGTVQNVHCLSNQHRRDSGTVMAHSIGSNAVGTHVLDPAFPSLTGVTTITDAGSYTRVRIEGQGSKEAVTTASYSVGSGSYTPNVLEATNHRIVITTLGAFTMNAPTGIAEDGLELELDIFNNSAGAIAITFASGSSGSYIVGGYTNPATEKRKTAKFRYRSIDSRWVQIGAWSADM